MAEMDGPLGERIGKLKKELDLASGHGLCPKSGQRVLQ